MSDDRRPQAWKQGSPDPDHGEQPDYAPRHGVGMGETRMRLSHRGLWLHAKANPVP